MSLDSIDPAGDQRVSHCTAELNGITYHYLLGIPEQGYKATIFLIHGWPDISIGWRNQIPFLLQMGFRVVCPDIMGFGGTDAPPVPPEALSLYGQKRAADDIKELARQLGASQIILGGHDWGGAIVYRVALWHPRLVTHLFSVCTPYTPPSKHFKPLEHYVEQGILPNFAYQLKLAEGQLEGLTSRDQIRQFLNGIFGGKGPNGELGFDTQHGVLLENLPVLAPTKLVNEATLDYYADQYVRNANWYRVREQNFHDELQLDNNIIDIPVLFIQATKDAALPPAMSNGMEKFVPHLTRKSVEAQHWALWERPTDVNRHIKTWLEEVSQRDRSLL
ncbi:hypothetical protein MMC07_004256 [Pseudocyphellaria aurata]|nr:hypothetical protein [Pseudocyphellaria aurata]